MTFKIQKLLFSTIGQPYLIYNKDRSVVSQNLEVGQVKEIDDMFSKDELKIYVKGYVDKKGNIRLNEKVEEQEW